MLVWCRGGAHSVEREERLGHSWARAGTSSGPRLPHRSRTVTCVRRPRYPYVHEATLRLSDGTEPAAVGAAVTVELCGHWEHEGGCRWPHNSAIRPDGRGAAFRTLFVAPPHEESEVRNRIERALRASREWTVTSTASRPLTVDEHDLAERLDRPPLPDPGTE